MDSNPVVSAMHVSKMDILPGTTKRVDPDPNFQVGVTTARRSDIGSQNVEPMVVRETLAKIIQTRAITGEMPVRETLGRVRRSISKSDP